MQHLQVAGRRCAAVGNKSLAALALLGLLCSRKCPGDVILAIYDAVRALRDAAVPVVGGFHSPMEEECFDLLLRGTQPVVKCPARNIETMQLRPPALRMGVEQGRVLLLSPFAANILRPTKASTHKRNALVADLATVLFVPFADPGGDVEGHAQACLLAGKPVLTLPSKSNDGLIALGAHPVAPVDLPAAFKATMKS